MFIRLKKCIEFVGLRVSVILLYALFYSAQGVLDMIGLALLPVLINGLTWDYNPIVTYLPFFVFISAIFLKPLFGAYVLDKINNFTIKNKIYLTNRLLKCIGAQQMNKTSDAQVSVNILVEKITVQVIRELTKSIGELLIITAIISYLMYTNFEVTMIVISIMSLSLVIYLKLSNKVIAQAGAKMNQLLVEFNQSVARLIRGSSIYANYSSFSLQISKFSKLQTLYGAYTRKYMFVQGFPKYYFEFIISILFILIVFIQNQQGLTAKEILSQLTVFGLAALKVLPGARSVSQTLLQLRFNADSVDRIEKLLSEEQKSVPKLRMISFKPEPVDYIKIENVTSILDKVKVIENYSCDFKLGNIYRITGPSGSGKSTLAKIIMKELEVTNGQIFYYKNNKVVNRASIAYVSQNAFVFNGTVTKNITFKEYLSSNERMRLRNVLNKVNLITELGPAHHIEEYGVNISGGQAQRIEIARALYHESSVLLLDEPTSALDAMNAKILEATLLNLSDSLIIICITHDQEFLKGVANEIKSNEFRKV